MIIYLSLFYFNDPAPTEIYTLSLHDALPISRARGHLAPGLRRAAPPRPHRPPARPHRLHHRPQQPNHEPADGAAVEAQDRKSTRLNSSHQIISYAVFCLKKKTHKTNKNTT